MKKKIYVSIASLLLAFSVLCASVFAYSINGYHISNTLSFTPYYGFGATTISHFNEALWQWNSSSGQPLMNRKATERHYSSIYPHNDGKCYIFAVDTNDDDYVAQTHYYTIGNVMVAPDINLNMHYSWANSKQVGKYDVWSVFLHEAGHAAGLSHSSLQSARMYKYVYTNSLRRYLTSDDIQGIQSIYSGITVSSALSPVSTSHSNTEYLCGCIKDYSYNELIDNSNLIVRAKMTGKTNTYRIKPVFEGDPQIFTEYYFEVQEVLQGCVSESKPIAVRVHGGEIDGKQLIAEDSPVFSRNDEVILFLNKPEMGGGYNTKGDYYYIRGVNQGAFFLNQNTERTYSNEKETIQYDTLVKDIVTRSSNVPVETSPSTVFSENIETNVKNNIISAECAKRILEESKRYATIVSSYDGGDKQ